jgi:hypothetical protein
MLTVSLLSIAGLIGCSSSGSQSSGGGGGGGGPTLSSIAITPNAAAVTVGGNVSLKATGTYSDQSTKDLTSTATWSVDQSSIATVSAGTVTGVAAGVATITAKSGSVSGSAPVDVTSQNNIGKTSLNNSYAFYLKSVDSRGQAVIVGSFTTDAKGNITGGSADFNTGSGVSSTGPVSLTGSTYTIWPDGRGEADIKVNSQTTHIAFVLSDFDQSGLAHKGRMISYDSSSAYGEFELQTAGANLTSSTSTAASNFVFGFNGMDSQKNPMAEIGLITTPVSGSTTGAGSYDVDDAGTIDGGSWPPPSAVPTFSAVTINAVGAGNRGTAVLGTANYAYYTIDSTKAYFIETDASGTALAGTAELQTATEANTPNNSGFIYPLTPEYSTVDCYGDNTNNTALEPYCNYAFLLEHSANATNSVFEKVGQLDFCTCGSGGVNFDQEDEAAGGGQNWQIGTGSRGFSAIGRGLISYPVHNGNTQGGNRYLIVYVVSNNPGTDTQTASSRMYMMNTDSGDTSPGVGYGDFINAVPTDAPANGTYTFSATNIGKTNLLELGVASFNNSNVTGIAYINNNGTTSTAAVKGTFAASTNTNVTAGDGKGTITPFDGTTTSFGAYSVGSNGVILIDTKTGVSGRMQLQ